MKTKNIFLAFALLLSHIVFSQNASSVLNANGFINLNGYLSKSLNAKLIGDSCYIGYYYIKFKLTKNGAITSYECSDDMPNAYKIEIKKSLDSLLGKWEETFIKMATRKGVSILQPIYLHIDNNCQSNSFISKEFSKEILTDSLSRLMLLDAAFRYLVNNEIKNQETFMQSLNYDNNFLTNCILLKPCIIKRLIYSKHQRDL